MKRALSTLILILILASLAYAQDDLSKKRNFSYVEAGGAGLFFSVNYERQLSEKPGLTARAGLGGYTENDFYVTYSAGLAYLFALNKAEDSFLDLGVNLTLAREYRGITENSTGVHLFENFVPGLSYRKHFNNDVLFKTGLNAVINEYGLTPWLHMGFGIRF